MASETVSDVVSQLKSAVVPAENPVVPFTFERLREDGYSPSQVRGSKHCRECGAVIHPFDGQGTRLWLEIVDRDGETLYHRHSIWDCDRRRREHGRIVR
jgi:hypothetical protein